MTQDASAETWQYTDGSTILQISGGWCEPVLRAVRDTAFDGLALGSGFETLEPLAEFAEKICWLHCPRAETSQGLSSLRYLERIIYVGPPHVDFDYRSLPELRDFRCTLANELNPSFLNHSALERVDLVGLKVKDLTCFSSASRLKAVRLVSSPLRTLNGLENLSSVAELRVHYARALQDINSLSAAPQLQMLELDQTPKISDVGALQALKALRWVLVDGRKASQASLDWLQGLPDLESACISVQTHSVNWELLGKHKRLYDVAFHTHEGYTEYSDEQIRVLLERGGRKVKAITHFSVGTAYRVELEPPSEVANPQPFHAHQHNLRYQYSLGSRAGGA